MPNKVAVANVFGDDPNTAPVETQQETEKPSENVFDFQAEDGKKYQYEVEEKEGKYHFIPKKPFASEEEAVIVNQQLHNTFVKAQNERKQQKDTERSNLALQEQLKQIQTELEAVKQSKATSTPPKVDKGKTQLTPPDYMADLFKFAGVDNPDDFAELDIMSQEKARKSAMDKQLEWKDTQTQNSIQSAFTQNTVRSQIQSIVQETGRTMDEYLVWCQGKNVDPNNISMADYYKVSHKPTSIPNKTNDEIEGINKIISLASGSRNDFGDGADTNIQIHNKVDTEKKSHDNFVNGMMGAVGVNRPKNRYGN